MASASASASPRTSAAGMPYSFSASLSESAAADPQLALAGEPELAVLAVGARQEVERRLVTVATASRTSTPSSVWLPVRYAYSTDARKGYSVSFERVFRLPAGITSRSPGKRADRAARRAAVSAAWAIGSRSRSSVSAQPDFMFSANSSDTPGYRPFFRFLIGFSVSSGVSGVSSSATVILLDTALDPVHRTVARKGAQGRKTCYRLLLEASGQ